MCMNYISQNIKRELKFLLSIQEGINEQKNWDEESIKDEALKYTSKSNFSRNSSGAYAAAKRLGIFDLVTAHMVPKQIKWTEDMIRKEAAKYSTKADFVKNSPKAADRARYYKIWDDVTKHMDVLGDRFKRLVYVYEFPNKVAYVGLTHDKKERDAQHRLSGRIYDYIRKTGIEPELKVVSDDYIDVRDAQNLENCTVELYRKKGWTLLNKAKTGSLGMCKVMWTKERVEKEIAKYKTLTEFRRGSPKAYHAVLRNKWLDDLTPHLKRQQISWTKDAVLQLAINYDNTTDFIRKEPLAYQAAKRNGWLEDVTKNMDKRNVWTDESLKNEMKKYDSLSDFRSYNNSAYVTANIKFGSDFINKFYGNQPKSKWTQDALQKEVSKYKTRIEFLKGNPSAYKAAERKGILQDIIKDLEQDFQWDQDKVERESKKYQTRMDFKKGSKTAYNYALKWDLLDKLIPSQRPKKK